MDVHISLDGRRDLTGQIYAQLRQAIVDGHLRPGDALPPTRELARRLAVSRTTVMVAYDRLGGEGFLASRVGQGTFVSEDVPGDHRPTGSPAGVLRPRAGWQSVLFPRRLDQPVPFDLRCGLPDSRLFPHDSWRRLVADQWRPAAVGSGGYGRPAGHQGLRAAIARHIATTRAVRVNADDVVVTSGFQQALDIIVRALLSPGDTVAVEDPGYPPARMLLESVGATVRGVPVDGEGLVVDAIPDGTRLVYVTPSHQFPTGVAMSLRRRTALLAWARHHDAAIVEDDYDSDFRFGGRPIEPLQSLDTGGRVLYTGSFSKTMLPLLRLGFVVAPASVTGALHAAKFVTDWHTNTPAQAAMASFIERGWFARHLRRMRNVYRVRHELVTAAMNGDIGHHLRLIPSAAGLHVSAYSRHLSPDETTSVVRRASAAGVECYSLAQFAATGPPRSGVVVGYGAIATEDVVPGLEKLAAFFDQGPTAV